ncbi:hypothetical protein F444_13727 [Phytophthora nicotianae P1976]|uniref:Ubiquitin-like protease family profile domain-containing protein n=1 Tax=Phytophthora nicotianae P1976 TaxID=1317066 RepID=A0A080ZSY4_PHYNI|nr:hypothetical protein F444_13727 [Phytophthora nicotianae P1976]
MDDDFMNTRVAESCRSAVSTEDFDYNFVIPKSLVIKLKAVIQAERNKRPKSKYFNTEGEDTDSNNEAIVAYFPGVTPRFTSEAVFKMAEFYNVVKKCSAWRADMEWLQTTKWSEISANPELFKVETDSDDLYLTSAGGKHQELANEVMEQLEGACLNSTFRLSSGEGTVKVDTLVGMLARDRMLSDVIINFSVRCICEALGDCYALDSFSPTMGCPKPPQTRISTFHYLVLPLHLSNIHWGVVVVAIAYKRDVPCFTPYYYEPMCGSSYSDAMELAYTSTVLPFLKMWHDQTMPHEDYPVESSKIWIKSPKQPDGTSCGVLTIAQIYSLLKDSLQFSQGCVTKEDISVMRLRIMWMIVMQPEVSTVANQVAKEIEATDIELLSTIKS